MRIVTPEESIKEIENISILKFLYHDWFGFRCGVYSASKYSDDGEIEAKINYNNCFLTLSKNILSLKGDKGFIWKIKLYSFEIQESSQASMVRFKNQYEEEYSLKIENGNSSFIFSPFGTPSIILQLNDTAFSKKVSKYFRRKNKKLKPTSKEVLLLALDEAEKELINDSFSLIRIHFEKAIKKDADKILNWIQEYNSNPLSWIYSKTSNISGNMVESGEYHIYRGALNENGQQLQRLFDDSTDKLYELGEIEKDYANNQKGNIREYIKGIG